MKLERDKFLTEAMGECWHEYDEHLYCKKCDTTIPIFGNYSFSTWEGFGKLYEWTEKQPWYEDLLYNYWSCPRDRKVFPYYMIHPDRFADAIFKFLSGVFPSFYLQWKESGRYERNNQED